MSRLSCQREDVAWSLLETRPPSCRVNRFPNVSKQCEAAGSDITRLGFQVWCWPWWKARFGVRLLTQLVAAVDAHAMASWSMQRPIWSLSCCVRRLWRVAKNKASKWQTTVTVTVTPCYPAVFLARWSDGPRFHLLPLNCRKVYERIIRTHRQCAVLWKQQAQTACKREPSGTFPHGITWLSIWNLVKSLGVRNCMGLLPLRLSGGAS